METEAEELQRLREWHRLRNSYNSHPGDKPHEWRMYDRMPIQIHSGAVILIQLFKGGLELQDMWATDMVDLQRHHHEQIYRNAAAQFHQQLEGHDCVAFWQALRDEADKVIKGWEEAKAT